MHQYVIVGAGLAGHRAAIELRKLSSDAAIILIGAEAHLPYDRPPLSKDFLLGKTDNAGLTLSGAADYRNLSIDHRPSTEVVAIERAERRVRLANGDVVPYDSLLLATGSRPRRTPYEDQACAVSLRTIDDAIRLKAAFSDGARVAIIGGGFIGLEVAAVARQLDLSVTVIEASLGILSRGLPPVVGTLMQHIHRAEGVLFFCGAMPLSVKRDERGIVVIRMPDREIEADVVVIGAGVLPNTELAEKAGLDVCNGIVVDHHCRTSDPAIFAAGEVTSHPNGPDGMLRRLESWRIAMDQPLVAAACMTGGSARYEALPWLWSDQYDCNLQVLGTFAPESTLVYRGDLQSRKWTLVALDMRGHPTGAVTLNNGRDISILRRTLAKNAAMPADWTLELRPVVVDAGTALAS